MPDLPPDIAELTRPAPPRGWRDRVSEWAESIDLTPARALAGLAVVVLVGVAGWRLLAPAPPPPEARLPFTSTTAAGAAGGGDPAGGRDADPSGGATAAGAEVVVHVAGAVATPGVHRLPAGSRVIDAVDAAGGAAADADLGRLNLAALVDDGQQVYVPRLGEALPPSVAATGPAGDPAGSGGPPASVNLNRATAAELEALPGVGPSIAAAIVAHRDEHGPFTSVDDLLEVRGIGDARLEQLRDLVTV